tara:strand:- start:372 stop:776 length:405 start_codon:yes stop_codon:yes gene_type:complete
MINKNEYDIIRNNVMRQIESMPEGIGKQMVQLTLEEEVSEIEDMEERISIWKINKLNVKLPKFSEEESEKYYGLKSELSALVEIFNNSEYLKSLMTKKGGKSYANGEEFVKSAFLDKVERAFKKNDAKSVEDSE